MMSYVRLWAIALVMMVVGSATRVEACTTASRYSSECPAWSVCSVYAGDCFSSGMLTVCSGGCQGGRITRLVLSAGAGLVLGDDELLTASLGVEVVPPILQGILAVHGQWWPEGMWRFGVSATYPVFEWLRLGVTGDGAYGDEVWSAGGGVRAEVFPFNGTGFIPLMPAAFVLEGGALAPLSSGGEVRGFATLGLRFWI